MVAGVVSVVCPDNVARALVAQRVTRGVRSFALIDQLIYQPSPPIGQAVFLPAGRLPQAAADSTCQCINLVTNFLAGYMAHAVHVGDSRARPDMKIVSCIR